MLYWLKLLYKNTFSNVELNGAQTGKINITRGVRQGCPISMIFFITTADALTRHITQQNQIKGFQKLGNQNSTIRR